MPRVRRGGRCRTRGHDSSTGECLHFTTREYGGQRLVCVSCTGKRHGTGCGCVQATATWHPAVHGKQADAAGERLDSSAKRMSRSMDGAADLAAALRHADSELRVVQPLANAVEPSQTTQRPFLPWPCGKGIHPPARTSKLSVKLLQELTLPWGLGASSSPRGGCGAGRQPSQSRPYPSGTGITRREQREPAVIGKPAADQPAQNRFRNRNTLGHYVDLPRLNHYARRA